MSKEKTRQAKAVKKTKADKSADDAQRQPSSWRYGLVVIVMLSCAVFLSYRALSIQVLNNGFLLSQGDARHLRTISLPAHRGMLLDRNGEVLALSSPVTTVWADPSHVDLQHAALSKLADIIHMPVDEIRSEISKHRNKEFVYLQRQLNPSVGEQVKALKIPGISTLREFKRYYPAGEVTSQLVGISNVDEQGVEGLELAENKELKGRPGKDRVLQDRRGHIIDSVDLLEEPQPGKDVRLSIDKRLQYIAYRELQKSVKLNNATKASLVLLDSQSGQVLAMTNYPSYNPNNLNGVKTGNIRNRAATDLFEPGSTMKPFVVAAGLDTKQLSPDIILDTSPGYIRVGHATIHDVRNHGVLDLTQIIQKSSNVGMTKIVLTLPDEMLWEKLSDMGFGQLTKSNFPGEVAGYLPFYGEWSDIVKATLSFGYGVSVTPLQLAQAYSIFANDGVLNPITLLKNDRIVRGRRVLSSGVSHEVLKMMESVVSREGTAWDAHIPGYHVAGKTGTVRKVVKGGGYSNDDYMAVFAGIAPASHPRLVAVVVVDDPKNKYYYGGKVAAPVFANVMSEALRLLNIAPDDLDSNNVRVASASDGGHWHVQ